MVTLIGNMYPIPAAPSGMSSVSAASGPYAAELRASSPNIGMPLAGPTRVALCLRLISGVGQTEYREWTSFYSRLLDQKRN